MTRNLESRLTKLEFSRQFSGGYVVHVCDQPTESEMAESKPASIEGRKIAIVPRACRTFDEWIASFGTGRQVMHINTGVPRAAR